MSTKQLKKLNINLCSSQNLVNYHLDKNKKRIKIESKRQEKKYSSSKENYDDILGYLE